MMPDTADSHFVNSSKLQSGPYQQVVRVIALRNFEPAYRRFGSKREAANFGLMSASASCGHAVAKA
jgi:hypothetical protein